MFSQDDDSTGMAIGVVFGVGVLWLAGGGACGGVGGGTVVSVGAGAR